MAPQEDEIEEFWKTYYASTFNPARLKTKTMQGEMPKRYWKNLPEAALIPELIAGIAGFDRDNGRRARLDAKPPHWPDAVARSTARPGLAKDRAPTARRAGGGGAGLSSMPAVARCDARRLRARARRLRP